MLFILVGEDIQNIKKADIHVMPAQTVDKIAENRVCLSFFESLLKFEHWFPLEALAFRGRSGSLLGAFAPVGSPLDALFPQESRTFRYNQLDFYRLF